MLFNFELRNRRDRVFYYGVLFCSFVRIYVLEDGDDWTRTYIELDTRETRKVWQVLMNGPLGRRTINKVIVTHHRAANATGPAV